MTGRAAPERARRAGVLPPRGAFFDPQPVERLEFIRALAPLAILGFLAGRMVHADEWLTASGFQVPDLGRDDYRQPMYLAPLSAPAAWALVAATAASGALVSLGLWTRAASAAFAACLAYLALADRLAAFTVSKLGPAVALALFLSPAGSRYGVQSWWRARRRPEERRTVEVSGGSVRFFQALVVVMYFGAGVAKLRGDWLQRWDVLWTHLHTSYQTPFTYWAAVHLPAWSWSALQVVTLLLEALAPLWFSLRSTRRAAAVAALGMHATIGMMFGPVVWFSLLMSTLVWGAFGYLGPRAD